MKCSLNQKGKVLPPYYLVNKRGYIEISTAMNSKYQDIGKSIMILKQAGAELCQAQVKLEVVVEVAVEFGVEIEACHF